MSDKGCQMTGMVNAGSLHISVNIYNFVLRDTSVSRTYTSHRQFDPEANSHIDLGTPDSLARIVNLLINVGYDYKSVSSHYISLPSDPGAVSWWFSDYDLPMWVVKSASKNIDELTATLIELKSK
ncbi:hypothetical protein EF847_10195 [Actinobacteria bacterium YIM 96077]|uniref:Uncharacterized protein n=1 Tax=Phytoactinopolyspora halophila TaxID=1981511 RepID=A0A329QMX7_9ACTN|nr:hypothetical protein EF847_10195 [Actinobacteria bacterium YIM 96077]RAW13281.1 hypothetical protein DPM12_13220 [Phytoactinopolyspora halophila]